MESSIRSGIRIKIKTMERKEDKLESKSSDNKSSDNKSSDNIMSQNQKLTAALNQEPRYGEIKCQARYTSGKKKGQQCTNGAYYVVNLTGDKFSDLVNDLINYKCNDLINDKCNDLINDKCNDLINEKCNDLINDKDNKLENKSLEVLYLCGLHSNKHERRELKKMSKKEKQAKHDAIKSRMELEAKMAAINLRSSGFTGAIKQSSGSSGVVEQSYGSSGAIKQSSGSLTLVPMRGMFVIIPPRSGWMNVYPNYMTKWQGIGLVYPQLSPMSLGPVKHGQPGIPDALNLEGYHQNSKFFSQFETEEEFKANQIRGFLDPIPRRHKFNIKKHNIISNYIDGKSGKSIDSKNNKRTISSDDVKNNKGNNKKTS